MRVTIDIQSHKHQVTTTQYDGQGYPCNFACSVCNAPIDVCSCFMDGGGHPKADCIKCDGSGWMLVEQFIRVQA